VCVYDAVVDWRRQYSWDIAHPLVSNADVVGGRMLAWLGGAPGCGLGWERHRVCGAVMRSFIVRA